MIALSGLWVGFAGREPVLQNLNWQIDPQRCYLLTGPSGSGKTTLLRVLAGLQKPLRGAIDGLEGQRIALQFQNNRLLPWCTAAENVALAMPAPALTAASAILRALELDCDAAYPRELSGGMQRRVALARAIAFAPTLLLLDEPFSGLDAALVERIAPYVRNAAPGLIWTSHHSAEAALLDAQVVPLDGLQGRAARGKEPLLL